MKKNKSYYMALTYPIQIEKISEGFCAFIPMLKGCKVYGRTAEEALKELEFVREGFFDVFLEMGKSIPEPIIHLDIPYDVFVGLPERESLEPYILY
jgi:predicted RNase H-like HicB family nuclease